MARLCLWDNEDKIMDKEDEHIMVKYLMSD